MGEIDISRVLPRNTADGGAKMLAGAEVAVFLVHLTTTAFMTGIIWFMQIGGPFRDIYFMD